MHGEAMTSVASSNALQHPSFCIRLIFIADYEHTLGSQNIVVMTTVFGLVKTFYNQADCVPSNVSQIDLSERPQAYEHLHVN